MNLKTTIHTYWFTLPKDNEAYENLKEQLKSKGLRCMESWGGPQHWPGEQVDGQEVELETDFLFDNQWNTSNNSPALPGHRVFDWAQDCWPTVHRNTKRGYWLEPTDEMRDIRDNTLKCGYCGAHYPRKGAPEFCEKCLGSEYLKARELHLLRLLPVSADFRTKRPKLTKEERAALLPRYKEAQLRLDVERDEEKTRTQEAKIHERYRSVVDQAAAKRDGLLWLLRRGYKLENVLYNGGKRGFQFGFMREIDEELVPDLQELLRDFPWDYEIRCADGRTIKKEAK